jgi:hypothetical protein
MYNQTISSELKFSVTLQSSSARHCETLIITSCQVNYEFENMKFQTANSTVYSAYNHFTVTEPINLLRQVMR